METTTFLSQTASYGGRRVLVTGHTGFKGSWMCAWLKHVGAEVTGLSLAPEEGRPSLYESASVEDGMTSVIGDIRDAKAVTDCMNACQPEIVFHMAAQALVRRAYHDPEGTYATNVVGTVNVLEAARACPSVKAIVVVTSDKTYYNAEWAWGYRETDRLGGRDPYSSSKACTELVAETYREAMFTPDHPVVMATARSGNVIGGGDWAEDRLVPDVIRAMMAGEPVVIRNPHAVRPWQHVLEPIRGYLNLGSRLLDEGEAFAQAWNFGPGEGNQVDVRRLAESLFKEWGPTETTIEIVPSPLRESTFLRLDISKAALGLQWRPALDFDDTMRMTVGWYRSYSDDPASAASKLEEQLIEYLARSPRTM